MADQIEAHPPQARRRGSSIRVRLMLLILLVTIPVSGERLVSLFNQRAERIADTEDTLHNIAVRAALAQQEAFASATAMLEVLSREAALLLREPAVCQRLTERLNGEVAGIQGLYFSTPEGRILCASSRSVVGMDISDKTYLARALASNQPVLSDLARGPSALAPLVLSKAERSDNGEPVAVVIVGLDLQWLSRIAAETGAAAGVTVDVIDAQGTVLVRYPNNGDIVGRNFAGAPLVQATAERDEGNVHVPGLDGVLRYVAFARFAGTDARLVVGMDDASILDPIDREILSSIVLHLSVLAVVLLVTWYVADRLVVQPIRRLAADISALGEGDGGNYGLKLDALADVGVQEFAPLVKAFSDLGLRLTERTSALQTLNGRLAALASTDGLTGLANRRTFDVQLSEDWVRSRDDARPLGVIMIDVDSFKLYNDALGHLAGDDALRAVARIMLAAVAGTPYLVARYGGEEFVVLLPGADLEAAREVAEDIRRLVMSLGIVHPGVAIRRLTVSAGVASTVPGNGQSPDGLLAAADLALYEAKGKGRNLVMTHVGPPAH
ncbi:sensor domain-containing diguanylate cyclase [Azorhizobium doebereinerae]|uniref:sensor domain-containing diguanylate cyclase n=1 Tax=Azorhizobium doebereinerae TaxID=281091 RepID=UPI0004104A96|nr:GGDEF domain-containing protein [Azorhizobium doebereinerae]